MSSKFSCLSPRMERFSLDLPRAVKNTECALRKVWGCA